MILTMSICFILGSFRRKHHAASNNHDSAAALMYDGFTKIISFNNKLQ